MLKALSTEHPRKSSRRKSQVASLFWRSRPLRIRLVQDVLKWNSSQVLKKAVCFGKRLVWTEAGQVESVSICQLMCWARVLALPAIAAACPHVGDCQPMVPEAAGDGEREKQPRCRLALQVVLSSESQFGAQRLAVGFGGGNSPLLLTQSRSVHTSRDHSPAANTSKE